MDDPGRKPLPKHVRRTKLLDIYANERERCLILRAAREAGDVPPAQWARRVLVMAAEQQGARSLST